MNNSLPLVLVSHSLPAGWLDLLENRCRMLLGAPDATHLAPELQEHLPEAQAILCLPTIAINDVLLETAPHLRVVSNMAVGVDNIDLKACTRRGIPVGNTPGVLTEATADLAIALLLAVARKLPEASTDAREGRWKTWLPAGWLGADLHSATLGIVGLGRIGSAVVERARSFGLRIIYHDRQPNIEAEARLGITYLPLEELLRQSDFISLHVPLTPQTRGLINTQALKMMKPNAILVNTARGSVVNTDDLLIALQEGRIAGAALDVTDPEPLPPNHPLYSLTNCLITPHIGSATHKTRRGMAERACRNLLAGLNGEKLPFCANPEVYA